MRTWQGPGNPEEQWTGDSDLLLSPLAFVHSQRDYMNLEKSYCDLRDCKRTKEGGGERKHIEFGNKFLKLMCPQTHF